MLKVVVCKSGVIGNKRSPSQIRSQDRERLVLMRGAREWNHLRGVVGERECSFLQVSRLERVVGFAGEVDVR